MKYITFIPALLIAYIAYGQTEDHLIRIEKALLAKPFQRSQDSFNSDIKGIVEAVDKNIKTIIDSLYSRKSRKYIIFQSVPMTIDDTASVESLLLFEHVDTKNILVNTGLLNARLDSVVHKIDVVERKRLYAFLSNSFENFSKEQERFEPQPIRLKYIKFLTGAVANIGMDIYGAHFLLTIRKEGYWNVTRVEIVSTY